MDKNYIVSENGTFYVEGTDSKVINILDKAIASHRSGDGEKLRLWYGDVETGRDWMEINDVFGMIGRSCGKIQIPILLKTRRSSWGGAILPHCIVKIMSGKKVIYQHPKYFIPELQIVENNVPVSSEYPYSVLAGNICIRNCKTKLEAEHEVAFHKGERNRY